MPAPPRPPTSDRPRQGGHALAVALEIARASGLGLRRGKVLVPTPRLLGLARDALGKSKAVESIELVPGDGEARLHLLLRMMGSTTRVVVRAAVATLHLDADHGALELQLLEAPTIAGKHGGKAGGVLGVLGAFGEAALATMGPQRIVQTVAELLGPPIEAQEDRLVLGLYEIPAVRRFVTRETALGRVGDLLQVRGARFEPAGLAIELRVRPEHAVSTVRARLLGSGAGR